MTEIQLTCAACHVSHPITSFGKSRHSPRGYEYICKEARAQRDKEARERKKYNKIRLAELMENSI